MLARAILIALALVTIITFADWFSAPLGPCVAPIQQHSESGKDQKTTEEYCSAGKIVALWRAVGRSIDTWHDDLTAAATVVIAIFTVILGTFTVRLARSNEIAADAAKRSADAAIGLELPILSPSYLGLQRGSGIGANVVGIPDATSAFRMKFRNHGRTAAELVTQSVEWVIATELPDVPAYKSNFPFTPGTFLQGDGNEISAIQNFIINLQPDDIKAIRESPKFLWVYGRVIFKDFLLGSHEQRWCAKWQPYTPQPDGSLVAMGFVYDSTTPPEYTKRT